MIVQSLYTRFYIDDSTSAMPGFSKTFERHAIPALEEQNVYSHMLSP
jgi:hypothetical protein